ncbi:MULTISPECIES: PLP-dependent aminotransferase family protein [Actinomadura]|uniref:PLP-dependent aminotransferase family protein n=1 Tax=Actinomadura yumaensis TaxID=111807 RepID=A0ABW2CJE0_9ACTN|nr:PLP-dependent aminotransferase family protein [Actinomadura sp. J1-007]MWK37845.1 aminotransferase class I/II-fold pyridoxal phosphate-dependent enzyme [Actinomadura sp. J1-007]
MPKDRTGSGIDLHLDLDPSLGRRAGLERALRSAVQAGRLAPGTALPSSRALALHLGVGRGTVSAAYDQLAAEGYLASRPGARPRVARVRRPGDGRTGPAAASPEADEAPRYDLRPGRPDLTAFPAADWLRSTRRVLATAPPDVHALSDPRGRPELRAALAGYLGRARGVAADPERIVVTSGYTQALGLLARVLADAGTAAFAMEDPGHPYHRALVRRAGPDVVPLPADGLGARTGLLAGAGFERAGAVVLTPAHQYPTGATLRPDRRHAATAWARATGGTVVEDDYDGEFRYDRRPVGAVQGTAPEHVVYVGTASKTLGPGLRLGWMVLPARLVGPVAEAKYLADAHTQSLGQLVLADMIESHAYDRHVRAARLRYRRRRDLLVRRLRERAPRVRAQGVAAGLHALLPLPQPGPDEAEALRRARSRGLAVQPLEEFWQRPGPNPQGLIVGYSTPPESAYPHALDALCEILR